jgi:hypothetical protein
MGELIRFGRKDEDPRKSHEQTQGVRLAEKERALERNAAQIDSAVAGVLNGSVESLPIARKDGLNDQNTAVPGPLEEISNEIFQTAESDNVSAGKFFSGLQALNAFLAKRYENKVEATIEADDPSKSLMASAATVVIRRKAL